MAPRFEIEITMGSRFVSEDDIARAEQAAAEALATMGVLTAEQARIAQDIYREILRSGQLLPDDNIWLRATGAANIALTQGWRDPNGASAQLVAL